jgi:hypothetical protein
MQNSFNPMRDRLKKLRSAKVGDEPIPSDMIVSLNNNNAQAEYIYYDVVFANGTTGLIPASYTETRTLPILEKQSDWKMSVLYFSLKHINAPLFTTTPSLNNFVLAYPPDDIVIEMSVFPVGNVAIYTFDQFLEAFNAQLAVAFAALIAAYDTIHGAGSWESDITKPQIPPGIIFNPATQLFTMLADSRMNSNNLPNTVVWANEYILEGLFDGVLTSPTIYFSDGGQVDFIPGYQNTNLVTINGNLLIQNQQNFYSLNQWTDITQLLILSDSFGNRKEFIGSPLGASSNNILTNFIANIPIPLSGPGSPFNINSGIQYTQPGEIKWIDLLEDTSLTRVNLNIAYHDIFGRIIPLNLQPGDTLSMKIVFARKIF